MSQIAVRLSDSELRQLDAVVDSGGFGTRAEAVRAGIRLLTQAARDQRIAAAYAKAYGEVPLTEDEAEMLDAAMALTAEIEQ
jgi:Arc/MetJ-type ribon-helix-helix transcriptional regulator